MTTEPRPLHEIARDIRKTWTAPNYAAKPYLEAMGELTSITDTYYADNAKSIVLYFLANAASWRGEDARRVKAELRALAAGGERFYERAYSQRGPRGREVKQGNNS